MRLRRNHQLGLLAGRTVVRWGATLAVSSSLLATGLVIAQSPYASAATNTSPASPHTRPLVQVAQAPLTLTSTNGSVGTILTLTTGGGSGVGAVSYVINDSGTAACTISGTTLSATKAGTCVLTATKAADATYTTISSSATTVTFVAAALKAQATLSLTSTSATVGTSLALVTSGGSGVGVVSYVINASGTAACTISGTTLIAAKAGKCVLTATKAADTVYKAISSSTTTVTFVAAPPKAQTALTLTSTSGTVGNILTLTSSGGSGVGVVSYVINDSGTAACTISRGKLGAPKAGTCVLTATKAADTTYSAISSSLTTVTFTAKVIAPQLTCRGEYGLVRIGRTVMVSIFGTHFYNKPTIHSNQAGTYADVISDRGTVLDVRVSLRAGSPQGRYVFTTTLANGHSCQVSYLVR